MRLPAQLTRLRYAQGSTACVQRIILLQRLSDCLTAVASLQAPPETLRLMQLKHLWLGLNPMTEMPLAPVPLQQLEWLCAALTEHHTPCATYPLVTRADARSSCSLSLIAPEPHDGAALIAHEPHDGAADGACTAAAAGMAVLCPGWPPPGPLPPYIPYPPESYRTKSACVRTLWMLTRR